MDGIAISFYILAFVTLAAAIATVNARNIFHAALFLIVALFGVAGFYVLLDATFLAAAQVLIYVGAIAVLMMFAVMLTSRIVGSRIRHQNEQVGVSAVVSLGVLAVILYALWDTVFVPQGGVITADGGHTIGTLLMTKFVLAFEVISILLLAALIGAVVIARKDGPPQPEETPDEA